MIGKRNTAFVKSPKVPANRFSLLTSVALSLMSTSALADPPTTKRLVGTLVSPSTAWSYYGTATAHTNGLAYSATRAPEIRALARALSRGGALTGDAFAQRAADYVRKNIETEFRFGLGKGARGAAIDQSGTVFDQAQLMVEILRERGQTATYQLGTITLNADQFGKWTGLVTNLSQANQTFTVNAQAACQMLADGGIPAIVNGASSCAGLSGALTTVTLSHLWVVTNGKAYDPGLKINILKPGIDIAAAMGCGTATAPTCGAALESAAMSGALQGAANGAPYIQNINQGAVENFVQARALSLQGVIEASDPTAPIEDIIGGATVDVKQSVVGAVSLPYPATLQSSWNGDVPDQYRVKFRVQFLGLDASLFADEISGKRVRLATRAPPNSWLRTTKIFVEGADVATGTGTGSALQLDRPMMSVDHPLAGGITQGTYGDASILPAMGADPRSSDLCVHQSAGIGSFAFCNVDYFAIKMLVLDVGTTGSGRTSHFNRLMVDYKEDLIEPKMNGFTGGILNSGYDRHAEAPSVIANFLLQSSLAVKRTSALAGSSIQQFHLVGGLFSQQNLGDGQLNFNLGMSMASTHRSAVETDAAAAFLTSAAAVAALEGSVFQQAGDAYESSAAVSAFKLANTKGYRFYSTTAGNIGGVLSATSNFSGSRKSALQLLATQGYTVIVPSNGMLGTIAMPGTGTGTISLFLAPELASKVNDIGYLVNEEYKGGGAIATVDPAKDAVKSATADSHSVKDRKYRGVDLASGALTFMPAPDLIVGSGTAAIQFKRSYSSANSGALRCSFIYDGYYGFHHDCSPVGLPASSLVGGGWDHNFNMSASWSGSGVEGLAISSAVRGSRGIASLFALFDVNRTVSFQRQITGIFASYSFIDSFVRNSVSVQSGSAQQFVKLPDGRFDPPFSARGQKLLLSGSPTTPFILSGGATIYRSYYTTEILHVSEHGAQTQWKPAEAFGNPQGANGSTFNADNMQVYAPIQSAYADGNRLNFAYLINTEFTLGSSRKIISSVNNSLGYSLSFSYSNQGVSTNPNIVTNLYQTYSGGFGRLSNVTSSSGQTISLQCSDSNSPSYTVANYFLSPTTFVYDCTGGWTDSAAGVTKFGYATGDGSFTGAPYPDRILKNWYTPLNGTTPYLNINYDPVLHVSGYSDIAGKTTKTFTTTIADDRYRVGEVEDPSGAVTSTIFDENASTLQVTDPLGRVTSNVYDSARRLLRTVMPDSNAVEYTYDLRGNKTRECIIPKGAVTWSSLNALNERNPQCNTARVPVADLATATTYMEAATLRADQCVNMKTCNKPSYVVDAKGARTDYEWSGVHGQLTKETGPADINGVRPVTAYGYSAYTGVDSAVFYLLTSKIETISSGVTTTTAYEYDTANKFVLKSSVVDSGGLSLRICYKFDPAGNLISKTEPKAGLAVCP
jgi:YD repeat-containing protein